jgi:hypothetical protein
MELIHLAAISACSYPSGLDSLGFLLQLGARIAAAVHAAIGPHIYKPAVLVIAAAEGPYAC